MAIATSTILATVAATAAVATAGAAIYGGIQARKQAKKEANLIQQDAAEQAEFHKKDTEKLRKRQKVAFLSSGVTLQGTPLQVLENTRKEGETEAERIRKGGAARADIRRDEGRTAFTSGLLGGIGAITKGAVRTAGAF